MSNEQKMVSVPRELAVSLADDWGSPLVTSRSRMRAILEQPVEQHQGEPVKLPSCNAKSGMSHDWDQGYADGWNACLGEIAKLGPLYAHAAPAAAGEVERLRKELKIALSDIKVEQRVSNNLRQRKAELEALLREVVGTCSLVAENEPTGETVDLHDRIEASLSASAEPSAPIS
ncbi:hypothetical protein PF66_05439 [Pseudomonas asplenii]|uniref:Uncharacterized protein n=1 Tax=Pseudomonas asplenii TaxID=53407 RepID=A0A0N0E1M2_9PSED|nr:hypothetical protein [Pseudomonas fuscovaginae]KPA87863.1 hypothetical protein PF66_05439 [Pseudomonas fuscovaginae]